MKKCILSSFLLIFLFNLFAQDNVAIYWDASYSMKDRAIDKELTFLDNYFKKYSEANVKLIVFSNEVLGVQPFKITNSDWNELKNELQNVVYDGATSFENIFTEKADTNFLFTDGKDVMGKLPYVHESPINIVATTTNNKIKRLRLLSEATGGRFYLLSSKAPSVASTSSTSVKTIEKTVLTGTVADIDGVLTNASVFNQTTGKGVATNVEGQFRLEASLNDIIVFSFLGKRTVRVKLDVLNELNINMVDDKTSLNEVVVNAKVEHEKEYVYTATGLINKDRLGYDVKQIESDEISDLDYDVAKSVQGKFANLEMNNQAFISKFDVSQFKGRGKGMTIQGNQYGLIVIDGVPIDASDSSESSQQNGGSPIIGPLNKHVTQNNHIINSDMIESVTYLKGLAATNRFGTMGRNGVLLITTKNAAIDPNLDANKKPLGTTETYEGAASALDELANTSYIKQLKDSKNVNEAFAKYLILREQHENQYAFFVNAADYFKGWKNPIITKRILSNINEFSENFEALKAVAFKQEEFGFVDDALITYKRIAKLFPEKSQSYRDLALAQLNAKNIDKALDIYDDILTRNTSVNIDGIKRTLTNEFKNLVTNKAKSQHLYNVDDRYKKPISYKSRIVFEWNNFDAEFDLSIINPQNRYVTISHTQDANAAQIIKEKQQGYALEEFYLTDADVGKWKFNMTYYGNTSNNPTFVKITTYKNYGTTNESKQVKVVRLDKLNLEQAVNQVAIN